MTELREIELKFLVEPDAVPGILAHRPLKKAFNGSAVRLASNYYDTKASTLRKAGLTLRVRHDGEGFVQTIKALSEAGAFDRAEWQCAIAGPGPDLSAASETPLEKLLAKRRVREGLAARFSTEVERSVAVLAEGESEIEAALDVGTVRAGRRSAPVCELELELKSGHPADLFRLAGRLAKTLPLTLSLATKSERGYALAAGDGRQPIRGSVPNLSDAMSAGDAFAAIARSLLHPAMANVALLTATRDAEALHQTRVSLRRLRAALWFFKAVVADDTTATVEGELRWIARLLGEARDLDVFVEGRLGTESERHAGEPGLAEFVSHVHDERTRAYDRALTALRSARFRKAMLSAVGWVETGPWRDVTDGPRTKPIREYAAALFKREHKRLLRRGANIDRLAPDDRHAVRIRAKKLRYMCELLVGLYAGRRAAKRHKALLAALSSLQEHLGALNDVATGDELIRSLAGKGGPAREARLHFASGLLAPDMRVETGDPRLKRAKEAYDELTGSKPFWR